MPIRYSIDLAAHRLVCVGTGALRRGDFDLVRTALASDPNFDPMMGQLMDYREASADALSAEDIRWLASQSITGSASARAYIVRDQLAHGLVRMFESLGTRRAGKVQVFRDWEAADKWLRRIDARREQVSS